jgi:hypothetical protein
MKDTAQDFAFSHNGRTFIVRATDEAVATAVFANKIKGRFGFFPDVSFDDIKEDIMNGNIDVGVVIDLG